MNIQCNRFYLFIFRQGGREGEREGKKWDLACHPGMFPDWESNWQPFGLQARAQSTEPHQPGLKQVEFRAKMTTRDKGTHSIVIKR